MTTTNKQTQTHKERANQKIIGRHYLDIIEERRISVLKLGYLSQMLYALLIEKYIYFFNENKLNSKGEFFQTYDDFKLKLRAGNLSDHLVRKGLDELIKKGFITRNKKFPEGVRDGILKYHYTLNFEKLDRIIISPEEYKLPNKKKYEIQQDIKYNHNTAVNKKNTPKVETTDNNMNDNSIATTYNSNDELIGIGFEDDEVIDNDVKEVIRPVKELKTAVKPIEEIKTAEERDDDDEMIDNDVKEVKTTPPIKLKRLEKGENIRRAIQKELSKQKEQEKKNIETIKEPIDNDNKAIEELNDKQPTEPTEPIDKEIEELNEHTPINPTVEPIKELKTAVESNRAKAKAIIDNKTNPKINDYLDKLKLTNYDIMFLLSDGYTDGSNKDLDDKKRILNLIADNLIEL